MSLDDRVAVFHDAATNKGKSKGPAKEVATLRKFIHKNQDQRFSDKATARLVDTISCWIRNDVVPKDAKEDLLGDALKMPFTVFGTKQKKQFLKWLHEITGETSNESAGTTSSFAEHTDNFEVIDVTSDGTMSLMNADGDEVTAELDGVQHGARIRTAFEANQGVKVYLNTKSNTVVDVVFEEEDERSTRH
eukprot:m.1178348 g.1178348  ORF g.1178348 m.1178348 type:complete len:191 (-) comp24526_c0_seq4:4449-5021(-)